MQHHLLCRSSQKKTFKQHTPIATHPSQSTTMSRMLSHTHARSVRFTISTSDVVFTSHKNCCLVNPASAGVYLSSQGASYPTAGSRCLRDSQSHSERGTWQTQQSPSTDRWSASVLRACGHTCMQLPYVRTPATRASRPLRVCMHTCTPAQGGYVAPPGPEARQGRRGRPRRMFVRLPCSTIDQNPPRVRPPPVFHHRPKPAACSSASRVPPSTKTRRVFIRLPCSTIDQNPPRARVHPPLRAHSP